MKFSKKVMAESILAKMQHLKEELKGQGVNYEPANGWDQVNTKGEKANRTYGAIVALKSILDEIGC